MGQVEENLEHLKEKHRYLVVGDHKVIYKVMYQTVYVTDVFDTRQDPEKIIP